MKPRYTIGPELESATPEEVARLLPGQAKVWRLRVAERKTRKEVSDLFVVPVAHVATIEAKILDSLRVMRSNSEKAA